MLFIGLLAKQCTKDYPEKWFAELKRKPLETTNTSIQDNSRGWSNIKQYEISECLESKQYGKYFHFNTIGDVKCKKKYRTITTIYK